MANKPVTEIDNFDFGFTSIAEEEFVKPEIVDATIEKYQKIIDQLLKAIDPLLNNLSKDADKNAYIHWPNRKEKIDEFRSKLNKIAKG